MATQVKSVVEKILVAEAASKSGLLANYAPAKTLVNEPGSKTPASWGPAMRK
jgi:hypothetical protein